MFSPQACPTSSVFTSCQPSLDDHAIQRWASDGVSFSLNTDDPGVMLCDLQGEYVKASRDSGLTRAQIVQSVCPSMQYMLALTPRLTPNTIIVIFDLMWGNPHTASDTVQWICKGNGLGLRVVLRCLVGLHLQLSSLSSLSLFLPIPLPLPYPLPSPPSSHQVRDGVSAAFLPKAEKQVLKQKVNRAIAEWEKKN